MPKQGTRQGAGALPLLLVAGVGLAFALSRKPQPTIIDEFEGLLPSPPLDIAPPVDISIPSIPVPTIQRLEVGYVVAQLAVVIAPPQISGLEVGYAVEALAVEVMEEVQPVEASITGLEVGYVIESLATIVVPEPILPVISGLNVGYIIESLIIPTSTEFPIPPLTEARISDLEVGYVVEFFAGGGGGGE